jgi:hypothetical protein
MREQLGLPEPLAHRSQEVEGAGIRQEELMAR